MPQGDSNTNSDYRGLPIEGLISAPLNASTRANSQMAIEQTKFLLDFCFTQENDNNYKPVMINLKFSRSFIRPSHHDDEKVTLDNTKSLTIQVPLLTIVPINTLAVNSVKLDFDLEITHQDSPARLSATDQNTKSPGLKSSSNPLLGSMSNDVQLFGQIGPQKSHSIEEESLDDQTSDQQKKKVKKKTSSTTHAVMSFEIRVGPSPLPIGLTNIINAYNKAITPSKSDN